MRTRNLAIVFTSIVGYAERVGRQTYDQSQRMLRLHDELVRPLLRAFGGRRIKAIGGTFLVAFESPTQAVLCGAALQDRVWQFNQGAEEIDQLEVRVGINLGEVRLVSGDVFGEPVNIAARIEALAAAGEVVFSEVVWLTMNRAEAQAENLGPRDLKGVPDPVQIYRVRRSHEGAPYQGEALTQAGTLPAPDLTRPRHQLLGRLRDSADAALGQLADAFPRLAGRARILAFAALATLIALAALLLLQGPRP